MKKNAVLILAAGKGTRMKSEKAKVLHEICEKPMIQYVIEESRSVAEEIIVIIGHQSEVVKKTVGNFAQVKFAFQDKQLGTGHAVKCAVPFVSSDIEDVIILCGDVPLIRSGTLKKFLKTHRDGSNDMTVLASYLDEPKGYGRLILDRDKNVTGIVEESDADSDQKKINLINSGIYAVKKDMLVKFINVIDSDNAQGEFYLTDLVSILNKDNRKIGYDICKDFSEILGVNDIKDLSRAKDVMIARNAN